MNDMGNDGHYEVEWPRAERQQQRGELARRLGSLKGKTVAQLWDYLFRGDEIFKVLEEHMTARFPGIKFVSWREFGNTHARDERAMVAALPARLKALGVDAVISGMAC